MKQLPLSGNNGMSRNFILECARNLFFRSHIVHRPRVLRDVATSLLAAALVFKGELSSRNDLRSVGEQALVELKQLGYKLPTSERPVNILPLEKGEASPSHAGGWAPGTIYLKRAPHSTFTESTYLRHELMHEAAYRSCKGPSSFPEWAEEAVALAFSGEVLGVVPEYSTEALSSLKKAVRIGASLNAAHRKVLSGLIHLHGWPLEPCKISPVIQDLLTAPEEVNPLQNSKSEIEYLLMHVASGRIYSHHGDIMVRRAPIGSLHKIPYVGFLDEKGEGDTGRALVRSDTKKLEKHRRSVLIKELCHLLLFPLHASSDGHVQDELCQNLPTNVLLGESDALGNAPFLYTLTDAARVVRIALQVRMFGVGGAFYGVPPHADDSNATLYRASKEFHKELARFDGWAKTGTVSSKEGEPLWGYLLVAWPQRHPSFIALFRSAGVRGASIAENALPTLRTFNGVVARSSKFVSLPVISTLPKAAYSLEAECREREGHFASTCAQSFGVSAARFSWSGNWRVRTNAHDARPIRYFRGTLLNDDRFLLTDPLTYTDAVSAAEGGGLPNATLEALRALVFWNATRGGARHVPLPNSEKFLAAFSPRTCDTTHWMVFMGERDLPSNSLSTIKGREGSLPSPSLLQTLDRIDSQLPFSERGWFEFSTGGGERWNRDIPTEQIRVRLNLLELDEVKRFRRRDGRVEIHLDSKVGHQILSCDEFSLRLDLPSCPTVISYQDEGSTLRVEGVGSGHGRGLSLLEASELARGGATAQEIISHSLKEGLVSAKEDKRRGVPDEGREQ